VIRNLQGTLPKMTDEHFTQTSLTSIAVAKVVKEKADLDEMRLIEDVNAVIQSSKSSSEEWELATFLLERLLSGSAYTISNHSNFSEILLKNLEQLKMLGKGGFGTVHKARWLGFDVAKKAFHGHRLEEMDRISTSFLQEVSILDGLHHPNIVSLLWYGTSKPKCYIIMELMDGDLQALMQRRMESGDNCGSPFNISEALDIMLQVGEGMLFLHERRIVHRDLKSHNILVKCVEAREVNAVLWHVKVADFGMSKTKEYSMTYSDQTQNQGTPKWMAPEMIRTGDNGESFWKQKLRFPFKCDIYSFGMVCYEILTGHVPFPNLSPADVKRMVLLGERPELPNECPPRLRTLIEACWSSEPSLRPHFGHICSEIRQMKCEHLMKCECLFVLNLKSIACLFPWSNDMDKYLVYLLHLVLAVG
jgi:serine/threonine protein kinase